MNGKNYQKAKNNILSKSIKSEKDKLMNLNLSMSFCQTQADLQMLISSIFERDIPFFAKLTQMLMKK